MTYKEWMQATGSRFSLTEADIDLILVNQGMEDKADEQVDVITAKRALVNEFASVLPMANVTEGGYSVTWNVDAMKLWYNQTCRELGIEPKIFAACVRNRSNLW